MAKPKGPAKTPRKKPTRTLSQQIKPGTGLRGVDKQKAKKIKAPSGTKEYPFK